jgi:hypothetical protein
MFAPALALIGCDAPKAESSAEVHTDLLAPNLSLTNPNDEAPAAVAIFDLHRAMRGVDYEAQLSDAPGVTWMLLEEFGALPDGLELSGNATITGTPQEAGLFDLVFLMTDADGTVRKIARELVVYEPWGYAHQPDMFDVPGFDDAETYAMLGRIEQGHEYVQARPLSVTSDADDPNTNPRDFLLFDTNGGDLQISVFFSAMVGKLNVVLLRQERGNYVEVATGASNNDDAHIYFANLPAGQYALMVEAPAEDGYFTTNAYMFRIRVLAPQTADPAHGDPALSLVSSAALSNSVSLQVRR